VGQGDLMTGSEGVDHKVDVRGEARAKLWSKLAASQTSIGAAFTGKGF
jgi:hypothetical protein